MSSKAGSIGVPTVSGMKGAFTDFAIGAGGGLVYGLAQSLFGSGLLGALAAPVLAGSILKGTRGTVLATIAGFMLLSGLGGGSSSAAASQSSEAVM